MKDIEFKQDYKQYIPIEHLLTRHIDRIMEYRSKKDLSHWMESIDALIDLLAPESEETVLQYKKEHKIVFDLSEQGKQRYILLFRFIKREWAKDNIIWKKSRGYERGHD
jgi:hypothetical protein